MPNLLAFVSYVFITTFTPGPNNIMSMNNASRYGFKKSMPFNLGVFAGFVIIMALCTLFSATLYRVIPTVKPFLLVIGALYILYLAGKTLKSDPAHTEKNSITNTFISGLLLQFVNPKVILYGITTVSTFVVPIYKSLPALMGFCVGLAFIGFISTSCWALFGSVFQHFLSGHAKIVNIIMAVLLLYCAVSLFL